MDTQIVSEALRQARPRLFDLLIAVGCLAGFLALDPDPCRSMSDGTTKEAVLGYDVAAEDQLGWHYADVGGGSLELVVDVSSEAAAGPQFVADDSQDGPDALDSTVYEDGHIGIEPHRVSVIARPQVAMAGGTVHFVCDEPRVESFEVSVLDVGGRTVFSGPQPADRDLTWDLRDDRGQPVPRGVYFFRATVRASDRDRPAIEIGKLVIVGGPGSTIH